MDAEFLSDLCRSFFSTVNNFLTNSMLHHIDYINIHQIYQLNVLDVLYRRVCYMFKA